MPVSALFPTLVYVERLQRSGWQPFNERLRHECLQLREDDRGGQVWSAERYPGGYTSYGSLCRMHTISPTFAELGRRLVRHVRRYTESLEYDLAGRELALTDCWVNIMPRGVVHSLHLHPHSTISGTYYVQTPRNAAGLKFEDPRLDRFMAQPPRRADAKPQSLAWVTIPAEAGNVVLFESWLRHEVPPNPARGDRMSISFNFNWF
jgi:uncharacterized protein (TIGR02466 family)